MSQIEIGFTNTFSEAARTADISAFGVGMLLKGLASNSSVVRKQYVQAMQILVVKYGEQQLPFSGHLLLIWP